MKQSKLKALWKARQEAWARYSTAQDFGAEARLNNLPESAAVQADADSAWRAYKDAFNAHFDEKAQRKALRQSQVRGAKP